MEPRNFTSKIMEYIQQYTWCSIPWQKAETMIVAFAYYIYKITHFISQLKSVWAVVGTWVSEGVPFSPDLG